MVLMYIEKIATDIIGIIIKMYGLKLKRNKLVI